MSMVGKKELGAVVVVSLWSSVALAQTPADTVAPAPSAEAPPPATAAPVTPPAPPPAPETAPPEPAPAQPEPDLEAPTQRPRVKWKRDPETTQYAPEEDSEEGASDEAGPAPPEGDAWHLGGSHFVLSLERMTTLLAWKQTSTVQTSSSGATTDISTSGTDVSFLFGGGERTPSSMPRIAFDGIFNGGFTLGGSVGLMASSAKTEANAVRGESSQPDLSGALFGFRAGFFTYGSNIGLWLRGGFTYISGSAEREVTNSTGSPSTGTVKATVSAWAFTLDPQLVVVAAPRIGITLGPLLDIPVAGTDKAESNGQTVELEYRSSAYGVTGGVAAIF